MKRSRAKQTRRLCNPERLEDRLPNAVAVSVIWPQTLTITGDDFANNVEIRQSDNGDGRLRVTVDGAQVYQGLNNQIRRIKVDLKGGNDSVWYGIPSDGLFAGPKTASFNLGSGNDRCTFEFRGATSAPISNQLQLVVDAGIGNDTLVGNFSNVSSHPLTVTALMGAGDDASSLNLWGDVSHANSKITWGGSVNFNVYGEAGNDTLTTWNTYDAREVVDRRYNSIDVSYLSTLSIHMDGGANDDVITALYSGDLDGRLNLYLNGSSGNDRVDATVNLQPGSSDSSLPFRHALVYARVIGGDNDDTLRFLLHDHSKGRVGIAVASMDGGAGFDHSLGRTSNVIRSSIEFDPFYSGPTPPPGGVVQQRRAVASDYMDQALLSLIDAPYA